MWCNLSLMKTNSNIVSASSSLTAFQDEECPNSKMLRWQSRYGVRLHELSHSQNRTTSASYHFCAWAIPSPLAQAWQKYNPKLAQFVSQNHRKMQSFIPWRTNFHKEKQYLFYNSKTKQKLFQRYIKYLLAQAIEQNVCSRFKISIWKIPETTFLQK